MKKLKTNRRASFLLGKKARFLAFLAACLAFIFFAGPFSFLGDAAKRLAAPLWRIGEYFRPEGGGLLTLLRGKRALISENQELLEKNTKLANDLIGYDAALQEVADLRGLLTDSEDARPIFAGVLSRGSGPLFDTLFIDRGEKDGIQPGSLVVAGSEEAFTSSSIRRSAVGTIFEAGKSLSKVQLFSSPGKKTSAFLGPENISVTLIGRGVGTMEVELPKDLDVREGDLAFLPGGRGTVVGIVGAIETDPTSTFVTVHLRLPANPSQLRYVGILQNTTEKQ